MPWSSKALSPEHLRSSKARAPLSLPLGESRPPVFKFERAGICTSPLEISPKLTIFMV